jgi:hypothetical protein
MNVSLRQRSVTEDDQQGFLSPVQKLQLNAAILLVVTILILIQCFYSGYIYAAFGHIILSR